MPSLGSSDGSRGGKARGCVGLRGRGRGWGGGGGGDWGRVAVVIDDRGFLGGFSPRPVGRSRVSGLRSRTDKIM